MKFSASMIKTWMKCQQQAYYRYVEGLPEKGKNAAAEFGTGVHLALEHYNTTGNMEEAKTLFADFWDKTIADPEVVLPLRTSFGSYREKGSKMLDEYFASRKWATDEVVAQEVRFHVPIGRHSISGIIDMLSIDDSMEAVRVTDYKSGYRPNANNLEQNIQFTSYLYAVSRPEFWIGEAGSDKYVGFENGEELFEKYRDYNKLGIWLDLRNTKAYDVGPRGTADIVRLYRCLDQIEKAIELEVFVPDISGDTCKFCSFQEECSIYLNEDQVGKNLELN